MCAEHHEPGIHLTGLSEDPEIRENQIEAYKWRFKGFDGPFDKKSLEILGTIVIERAEMTEQESYYLGKALIALSEGKSVTEAFNLASGRPKDENKDIRDVKITVAIYELMDKDVSLEKACYEVGEKFNVSEHTAAKAYKHWYKMIENAESGRKYIEFSKEHEHHRLMFIRHDIKVKNISDYLP